jgi:hypothetical protein
MKYKTIRKDDIIIIITEDGGLAEIHYAEELDEGDGRQSTTEYYQNRFTEEDLLSTESIWDILGEGKAYYNDWTTPFDDPNHIIDALNWLAIDESYQEDNSIWPNINIYEDLL